MSDLELLIGVEDISVDTVGRLVVELRLSKDQETPHFIKVKKGDEFTLLYFAGAPTIEVRT